MSAPSPDSQNAWTIGRVLAWTQRRFTERGIPSPRLDAELLLCHALSRTRVALYTAFDQPLSAEELAAYRALIVRRQEGEPVAYLIGKREFWSLSLEVSPAVLIPRPETETLVEVALSLLRAGSDEGGSDGDGASERVEAAEAPFHTYRSDGEELTVQYDEADETDDDDDAEEACEAGTDHDDARGSGQLDGTMRGAGPAEVPVTAASASLRATPAAPRIADIGTGSGALALALKKELPGADVVAVDASAAALAVARGNAARLGLAVDFREGDLLEPLRPLAPFHLIVSNPPYIPAGDLAGLPAEVRTEPRQALDGGPDGLAIIRRLVAAAPALLVPGGALALEVGAGQAEQVAALLRAAGFADIAVAADLARIPRVVAGRR